MATPFGQTTFGSGLIGSGLGVIDNLAGGIFSGWRARQQLKYNKQLADYQFQKNLDMWNLQNQYNSPAAQMQRFREAGLNPNLIYGQGNSGNASTLPRYDAPQMQLDQTPRLGLVQNLAQFQDMRLRAEQIDQTRANAELIRQRAVTEQINQSLKNLQKTGQVLSNQWRQFNLNRGRSLLPYQMQAAFLSNEYKARQNARLVWDMLFLQTKNAYQQQLIQNARTQNQLFRSELWTRNWENDLRRQGIDPKRSSMDSIIRSLFGDPDGDKSIPFVLRPFERLNQWIWNRRNRGKSGREKGSRYNPEYDVW